MVRYFLVTSHYRSHINYSEDNLKQAQQALERFYTAIRRFSDSSNVAAESDLAEGYRRRFAEAMDDDFNTPEALAVLFEVVREINRAPGQAAPLVTLLKELGAVLGLLQQDPDQFLTGRGGGGEG